MRKNVLFLAVLFMTVPAMAVSDVNITCSVDVNEVTVSYESTGDANLIRAFGLYITVDDANIVDVCEVDANYRIYPGQISIEDGEVNEYNTSYDPCDIGDANVAIEMGSLYTWDANYDPCLGGDPNAGYGMEPGLSGILLRFYVDGDCNYVVAEEPNIGGVVMEDPYEEPNVDTPLCSGSVAFEECYTGPEYDEWVKVGKPDCWCASVNPRQCLGDVDGIGQGKGQNIYVSTWDTEVFRAAYGLTEAEMTDVTPCDMTVYDVDPNCTPDVCDVLLICADVDHTGAGKAGDIRVSTTDTPVFRNPALDPNGNYGVADLPDNLCP